jgi:hypothetical protein
MVLDDPSSPSISGDSVESDPLALFLASESSSFSSSLVESELSSLDESSFSPLTSSLEAFILSEPSPELPFSEDLSLD